MCVGVGAQGPFPGAFWGSFPLGRMVGARRLQPPPRACAEEAEAPAVPVQGPQ